MYVSDSFVKAQHQYRAEQLKKSYPKGRQRRQRRLLRSYRNESPRLSLKQQKAW